MPAGSRALRITTTWSGFGLPEVRRFELARRQVGALHGSECSTSESDSRRRGPEGCWELRHCSPDQKIGLGKRRSRHEQECQEQEWKGRREERAATMTGAGGLGPKRGTRR